MVVVGAGPAGIAAARDLKAAGVNFIILEAAQRIGGRILNSNEVEDQSLKDIQSWGTVELVSIKSIFKYIHSINLFHCSYKVFMHYLC